MGLRVFSPIVLSLLVVSVIPATATASTVLAMQDFEGNSLTFGLDGTGDDAADMAANASFGTTALGTFFDSGLGLAWTATFEDSANGTDSPIDVGGEGGDVIGVVDVSVDSAINGTGSVDLVEATNITGNWFNVDDADGNIVLSFETVDATGFLDLTFDFDWAANSTGYEDADFFDISINGESIFNVSGDALESGPFVDNFAGPTLDISAFDDSLLDIVVTFSTSAGGEDIGFDNLLVSGTVIPEPSSIVLAGLGGVALAVVGLRKRIA